MWQPLLDEIFEAKTVFIPNFSEALVSPVSQILPEQPVKAAEVIKKKPDIIRTSKAPIDILDKQKWPLTNSILDNSSL